MRMWSVRLTVGDDGVPEVTGLTEGVPPGEIEVRGHDNGTQATLVARQRDPQGRFTVAAYHRRDRAEEALERAEEVAEAVTGAGGEAAVSVSVAGEVPAA